MKKTFLNILLCALTFQIISCRENNKIQIKTDLEFAEDFIGKMEPQKAIPFLTSIEPANPDYQRAQELLKVIGNVYDSNVSISDKPKTENENIGISKEALEKLTDFQNKWAKQEIKTNGGYLSKYRIDAYNKIVFVLGKETSEGGTSLEEQERSNLPSIIAEYNEALKKNNLSSQEVEIHLELYGGKEQYEQITTRQENIDRQFSAWDGSHSIVDKYIKEHMNNPDSYEHVETSHSVSKNYLIVLTTFRGTNSFGAVVTNQMKFKVSLDSEGNPTKIKELEL